MPCGESRWSRRREFGCFVFVASSLECGFHCVVLKGRPVPVLTKLAHRALRPGCLPCARGPSAATEKVIGSAAFASRLGSGGETRFPLPAQWAARGRCRRPAGRPWRVLRGALRHPFSVWPESSATLPLTSTWLHCALSAAVRAAVSRLWPSGTHPLGGGEQLQVFGGPPPYLQGHFFKVTRVLYPHGITKECSR